MEVSPAVLVKVGQALGVEGHARVAAAYLIAEARNAELFQNMLPQPRGQGPLLPMQLEMSVGCSDVLTAVQLCIDWMLGRFSGAQKRMVKESCLRIMAAQLPWGTATLAYEELAQEPDWQSGLKVALAYAHRHNIVCRSGDSFVSSHITTDARRDLCQPPLEQVNLRVCLSQRSVCSLENTDGVSRWLVYAGCGRGQTVRAATMLPESVAALFGSMAEALRTPSMAQEVGKLSASIVGAAALRLGRAGFRSL